MSSSLRLPLMRTLVTTLRAHLDNPKYSPQLKIDLQRYKGKPNVAMGLLGAPPQNRSEDENNLCEGVQLRVEAQLRGGVPLRADPRPRGGAPLRVDTQDK